MNISKKLFIGFALVSSLAIIVGIIGIVGMSRLHKSGLSMYEKQVEGLEHLGRALASFKDVRLNVRKVMVSGLYDDLKRATDAKEQFKSSAKEFEHWMNEFYKVTDEEELLRFHDRIMALFRDEYILNAEKIVDMSINDIPDHTNRFEINVTLASMNDVIDRIESLNNGILDLEEAIARQASEENTRLTRIFMQMQLIFIAAAVIISVSVTVYVTEDITKPINEAADVLSKIAEGDFEARITGGYQGEFAIIKDSVNMTAVGIKSYIDDKIRAQRSAHEAELAKGRAEAESKALISGMNYASKIQKNLLPEDGVFEEAFSDYSVIWSPRDIVGGDIYWIKSFDEGTVLCVCDCTGHGTSGALLTMLVVSAFDASIDESNYKDTAQIMWKLEQSLTSTLNVSANAKQDGQNSILDFSDGCDLAVLFISKDGSVTVSSGNTHVFVCDGKEVVQIKGQRLRVGEGGLNSKEDVRTVTVPANPDNKFYIASDGLYDQIGGERARPFGYGTFKRIILENHSEEQAAISDKIWKAFESYRGGHSRRDDVELITFKP